MTTIKQKLCNKLGITEQHLKSDNLFSPTSNIIKTQPNTTKFTDKTISYNSLSTLSANNYDVKKTSQGSVAYQNFKIDILVPNSEPPKPQIQSYTSMKETKKIEGITSNLIMSPLRETKQSKVSYTNLENLTNSKRLSNVEMFSPVVKLKNDNDSKTSCKFLLLITN